MSNELKASEALNEAYPLARAYIKENPTACAQELQAWRDTGVYTGHHLENVANLLRPVSQYDCMKLADDLVLEYALKVLASGRSITDGVPDAVLEATAEVLGEDAYDNTRCWTAWAAGTMGPNDFTEIAGQPDRVAEIAAAAIAAWEGLK